MTTRTLLLHAPDGSMTTRTLLLLACGVASTSPTDR